MIKNTVGKGENAGYQHFSLEAFEASVVNNHCAVKGLNFHNKISDFSEFKAFEDNKMNFDYYSNSLPHMPILGSSNLAANKDMMSQVLTNGDTIF